MVGSILLSAQMWSENLHVRIYDLRCNGLKEPIGVDTPKPFLTWKLENISKENGIYQSAYQILVSSSIEKIKKLEGDLWDSGRVECKAYQVVYGGEHLQKGQRVWWRVRIWDDKGRVSDYSEPSFWEMGLISDRNWLAKWIEPPPEIYPRNLVDKDLFNFNPAIMFRKKFSVDKQVKEARLYISGLGYCIPYINGVRVGDNELDPGWTAYEKRVFYSVYDITDVLKQGDNVVGAVVGSGWYNPLPLKMWGRINLREHLQIGVPKLKAQIEVRFEDGSNLLIASDNSWKTFLSPIIKNNVYLGEEYDESREQEGWNSADFDDSNWYFAVVNEFSGLGKMEAQPIPPIKVGEKYSPKNIGKLDDGKYIFDFGQNLAGRICLKVKNCGGKTIQVRCGELLYPEGTLNPMTSVCGQIKGHVIPELGEEPFTAEQKDIFHLVTDGEKVLTTNFTYHGFRYAEISGIDNVNDMVEVRAERLHTPVEKVGKFECFSLMENLLNQIQKMCVETLVSNLHSVETDCPHREKFGYGGDIVAASEFAMLNFDMWAFYRKVVRDFADEIRPNGGFTETAPFVGIADHGFGDGSGPLAWGIVHPFLLWQLYQYYGDRLIVEEQYEYAKRWIELLEKSAKDCIQTQCIGDHESIAERQVEVTATAYYFLNAKIMCKLARILNKVQDVEKYEKLSVEIAKKFKEKFLDESGRVGKGTQANQSLFLAFGMGTPEENLKVQRILIDNVVDNSGRLTTGIFGTKYLLRMLCEAGAPELAFKIVNSKEFPGWGFMLSNGATTLWEHWEFSDNVFSHNHPMFGSVSEWFYKDLGGIAPDEDSYGFNRLLIKPEFSVPLEKVNCEYESARGKVVSSWQKMNPELIKWRLVLPPNTVGRVILRNVNNLEVDGESVDKCNYVKDFKRAGDKIEFLIENGFYDLEVKGSF